MALSAVIFDFDGTLVDTNRLHARAWQQAFEARGVRVPVNRLLPEIGKGGDKLVPAVAGEAMERAHGEALRTAQGEALMALIGDGEPVEVFPEVRALLAAVREAGLKTAVATGSGRDDLEQLLERAGLDLFEMVDAVVTDSDVEESKPHPESVERAAEKLDCAPAECALVGDTPYDAGSAKRAGAVGLGVRSGVHSGAALRRAGMRATYAGAADVLASLEEALEMASPGSARLTPERMEAFMQEALAEAAEGLSEGEVPIGSALLRGDGTVVARSHNRARATGSRLAHAEMEVLREAAPEIREADGLLLVTTLEPCVMCLGAAMEARVDTVIYALDAPPNGGTRRCAPLDAEGAFLPRLVGGVGAEDSRALLKRWLKSNPGDSFARALVEDTEAEGA